MSKISNQQRKTLRHARVRAKISGTAARPRLCVFRSNTNIYAQIIDDTAGKTLASASDLKEKKAGTIASAQVVGTEIAKKAKELKVSEIVFDRGGYQYHGKVKSLADAAREGGLKF